MRPAGAYYASGRVGAAPGYTEEAKMRRTWLPLARALSLGVLLVGASGTPARATSPEPAARAAGDTLTISLPDAHRRALGANPEFLAERQAIAIARGRLSGARSYPFNPELEFRAPGVGARDGIGEYELSLSQEIEWAGQRGLRIGAARAGLDGADAAVNDAARRTLAAVSDAFYSALAAEQRLEVTRELARLSEQLVTVTRIQAAEGEISVMDANLVEIEVGRARAAVLSVEREYASALIAFRRLVDIGADQPIQLRDDVPDAPTAAALDIDSLVTIALARRPDLAARSREAEQADALIRLARREAIPNPRLGVFVEREERDAFLAAGAPGDPGVPGGAIRSELRPARFGLGITLPLPVFHRNQGAIEERIAESAQAGLARQAAEVAIRAEVEDAYQAYRSASEEHRVLEEEVLQPARANQRLLDTALLAGKVGLPTMLLLRNQLLDAEIAHWDAWLAERRALVALGAATATVSADLILNPAEAR